MPPKAYKNLQVIISILLALLISLIIIFLVSDEPLEAINIFLTGPFSSIRRFGNLLEKTIPLIFTGLAASIMFQAKQFSLIGDSSFVMGGLISTILSFYFNIHPLIAFPLMILISSVVASLCGIIPGYLKAKWNANEFVVSMMMNSIIQLLVAYILLNLIRDSSSGFVASYLIPDELKLPIIIEGTRVHIGLIIALFVAFLSYILLYKTKLGFDIRMVGHNSKFASYSGIKVFSIIFLVQIIGAFIAGMGGSIEVLGMYDRFQWVTSPGVGFDGMTVAILASNNPALVPLGALFMAFIRTGSDIMARTTQVPNEMVYIIQGLVMIFVTANFLINFYGTRRRQERTEIGEVTDKLEGDNNGSIV